MQTTSDLGQEAREAIQILLPTITPEEDLPVFIIGERWEGGKFWIPVPSYANDEEKEKVFKTFVPSALVHVNAASACVCGTGWSAPLERGVRPIDSPRRREAIYYAGQDKDGGVISSIAPLIRHENQSPTLDEWIEEAKVDGWVNQILSIVLAEIALIN